MELLELLCTLNQCHGPSGDEREIGTKLAELAKPYTGDIHFDTMGNLIVHKKGNGPKVMFSAHMDSIGFIVTHVEEEGYLRLGKIGGVDPKEVLYSKVRFKNGTTGVVLKDEKAEFGKLKMDDLLLDIGADSKQQALEVVNIGDTAVYDAVPSKLNHNKVSSVYMDNRISCAILLSALAQVQESDNDLYFVFSAQEEVGLRGAKTAAYAIAPDYALAVDVTTTDDVPGGDHSGTTKLGGGAGIKIMDSSVICHKQVIARLEALAKDAGIATQREIMRGGGTDAGAIHISRGGVRTGGISVPCRYTHTPVETVDMTDVAACRDLLIAFACAKIEKE